MCLVGYADGELTCDQLGTLGRQLDRVGWCDRLSDHEIDGLLERGADRARTISELPDPSDALARIAAELDTRAMRRKAYTMALAMAIDPRAAGVLGALARVFAV